MKIDWSNQFFDQYVELLEYLQLKWGKKAATTFKRKLIDKLIQVQTFPNSCQTISVSTTTRRCVVNPNCSLVYKVRPDHVYIIALFQNRMHPFRLDAHGRD